MLHLRDVYVLVPYTLAFLSQLTLQVMINVYFGLNICLGGNIGSVEKNTFFMSGPYTVQ